MTLCILAQCSLDTRGGFNSHLGPGNRPVTWSAVVDVALVLGDSRLLQME